MNAPRIVRPHLRMMTHAQDSTKRVIIQTALRMFAQRGIEGVSLSELRSASGQNNRSAIHYHFGNKDGLLDAVTEHLYGQLVDGLEASTRQGRERAVNGTLDIASFVQILHQPFLDLYLRDEEGRDCIRLLSHLCHETTDRQLARAFNPIQGYLGQMAQLMRRLRAGLTTQACAPLIFMTLCSVMEILICSPMLTREHALEGEAILAPRQEQLIEMTLRFAQGGLISALQPSSVTSATVEGATLG